MKTVRLIHRAPGLLGAALLLALGTPARAFDLMEAWQGAQQHAPDSAMAEADREAGAAQARQARALWRPNAYLEGGAAYANSQTSTQGAQFSAPGFGQSSGVAFDTSVNGGTATRYALALRQPVYNRERSAQSDALDVGARAAELQWRQARQDLMLATTQAYFDVVLATERLRVLRQEQASAERVAVEARDRFRAGDRPITEVHEADARASALRAQALSADSQLALARNALQDLTGLATAPTLAPPETPTPPAPLPPLSEWLGLVERQNLAIQLAQAQLEAAQARSRASGSAFSPTVDLVARVARDDISGNGSFGSASSSNVNSAIGVQLSLPLFTGGLRGAQHDEGEALAARAQAGLDRARQQVAQQARGTWLDLNMATEQVGALRAALQASMARLDATRTGLQAGDRTTLDLLNAGNDAAAAELALLDTRVRLLMQDLRLAALAGELDDFALQQAQARLQPLSPTH